VIILITGFAGFIGSNLIHSLLLKYPNYLFVGLDSLTYSSNLNLISDLEGHDNFIFRRINLNKSRAVFEVFEEFDIHRVIHLAAESHVDNSISDPLLFARTNVIGTLNLLEACRIHWQGRSDVLFYQISTDEVFGSLSKEGSFNERTSYDPHSPYSASKASSDHFVRAYHHTYGLPVVISNCSNNYGPYQHDEKLIPTVIRSIVNGQPIPIYGDGSNIRDWLFVGDHAAAIDLVFHRGQPGQTYCIGGDAERTNLDLVRTLIDLTDEQLGNPKGYSESLISFVPDRKGHDFRYAIDHTYITDTLGWTPTTNLEEGLRQTVAYYVARYRGGH
jgi:dTDP-glucose 4,6-dehydratase